MKDNCSRLRCALRGPARAVKASVAVLHFLPVALLPENCTSFLFYFARLFYFILHAYFILFCTLFCMRLGCVLPISDWPVAYNYLGNGCEGPVIAAECSNVNCAEGYHLALDYTEVQRFCAKDAELFVLDRCLPGDCVQKSG